MSASDRVEKVLRHHGGTAPLREIVAGTTLPYPTVRSALERLVSSGLVEREAGWYSLVKMRLASAEASELVELILDHELDAHLSGLDLLLPYAQQFMLQVPHLIYADPADLQRTASALAAAQYVVVYEKSDAVVAPAANRVVLLRRQSADYAQRFGVVQGRATLEKAWIDTLREARAGRLSMSAYDLGQILGAAEAVGTISRRRVRTLANRAKLKIDPTVWQPGLRGDGESAMLQAGYFSERVE